MYVSRTRFETLDENGTVVSTTYGARVYDDMGCAYANHLDTLEELLALDANALIAFLGMHNETAEEMLDIALEIGIPLYVDEERYRRRRRQRGPAHSGSGDNQA